MEREFVLYSELASLILARQNCENTGNKDWQAKHVATLTRLVSEYMPSGSGIDCGTKLDIEASHADKLVFHADYHHMDDAGFYDGWTEHTIFVTPSLWSEFHIRVTGRDRNQIKEYLSDVFDEALQQTIHETWENGELKEAKVARVRQ